ncbi:MAG: ATP-binding protein [Nanoarchaeota archaeon]
MEKERIIEILNTWNFWTKYPETGIARASYLEEIEKLRQTDQVVVITGVRRSGKSTLIKQYIYKLIQKGQDRKNFLYINLEEPKFVDELSLEFLQNVYESYLEIVKPEGKPYLFLDEVQLIPKWEKFVRALHEKKEAYLFVSGSSAKLLGKEFATVLAGRHADLIVYPLNFKEFLEFKGLKIKTRLDLLASRLEIKRKLREYLQYGGFPLVVLKEEKEEILIRYFEDIVIKDVTERYKIKKTDKLKSLARYYLTNIGSLISFRKIKNFVEVSLDSIERFSSYLQSAYLIFLVNKFSYSLKEQEINPKKVYCIDLGLRNLVGFKFSEDLGKIYENAVFLKLAKEGQEEVFYWKNKKECDFVIKKGRSIKNLIQVSYKLAENKEREVNGLLEAMENFKLKEGLVITEDYEAEEKIKGKKVKFIPLWKWLI